MMDTTSAVETTNVAATNARKKSEHFKAGVIDFTAGSLGED